MMHRLTDEFKLTMTGPAMPDKKNSTDIAPRSMLGTALVDVRAMDRFMTLNLVWPYAGLPTNKLESIVALPPSFISWL